MILLYFNKFNKKKIFNHELPCNNHFKTYIFSLLPFFIIFNFNKRIDLKTDRYNRTVADKRRNV